MTDHHLPVFDVVEHAAFAMAREWNTVEEHVADVLHHRKTPAAQPVNLAAATAAAPQQEDTMSLFDDAEAIYAGAKTELGKFEQALPGVLAKAKQLESSPFAQLVEKAAGSVLPPEAVTVAVNAADKVLDDLIGLYGAPAQDTAPAQPVAPVQ